MEVGIGFAGTVVLLPCKTRVVKQYHNPHPRKIRDECEMWRKIYPEFDVFVTPDLELSMPYFPPVGGINGTPPVHRRKAVIAAIDHFISKGYFHRDFKIEHLGLHGDRVIILDLEPFCLPAATEGDREKMLAWLRL